MANLLIDRNIHGPKQYRLMMSGSSGVSEKMFPHGVTPSCPAANDLQMECGVQERVVPRQALVDLDRWMERYQQADPDAPATLVGPLAPPCFDSSKARRQAGNRRMTCFRKRGCVYIACGIRTALVSRSCRGYMRSQDGCAWTATAGCDASRFTKSRWSCYRSGAERAELETLVPHSIHSWQPCRKRSGKWLRC